MATKQKTQHVRLLLGIFFALFLIVNAILNTLAVVAGVRGAEPLTLMPSDTSPAVRLLIFVIGIVLSWLVGRTLYKFLINGELPVGDSTNTSYVMLFYLLMMFAGLSFLGILNWFLLPFLFLVLLVFSVFTLWRLIGLGYTFGSVVAAFAAAFITFYLISE